MSFYLIGVDEAGYGPQLGPLVVSAVVFELADSFLMNDNYIPQIACLWEKLSDIIIKRRIKSNKLIVCDSKKLYQPSRGIRELETTVLAFKCLINHDWSYEGLVLPIAASKSKIDNLSVILQDALNENFIRFCDVKIRVIESYEFNKGIEYYRNKADFLWVISSQLIKSCVDKYYSDNMLFVRAGKQGGRNYYNTYLNKLFPDKIVQPIMESFDNSLYIIFPDSNRISTSRIGISFIKDGDATDFVIALASIFSKYFRELSMIRLNSFFRSFVPSLKPTTGYYTDSERFIKMIMPVINNFCLDKNNFIRNK
jgi:ribonuclease HII